MRTYAQAVKDTAQIPKSPDATKAAERLLGEWTGRFLSPFGVRPAWSEDLDAGAAEDPDAMYLNKKRKALAQLQSVRVGHQVPRGVHS